ncbi:MAG TPA: histidine kinase [Pedobacter sp.]|jgi:sensor histidine kinase YesM
MNRKLKSLFLGWLSHYVLVQVAILLAYIIEYMEPLPNYVRTTPWEYFVRHTFHEADSLVLIFTLLFIELNFQFLFKKSRLILFVVPCILVGGLSLITLYYLNLYRFENGNIPFDVILYVAGYAFLYSLIRDYFDTIRHKKNIQRQQYKSELDSLKAHLNPHFLFNSLNYLYGTALTEKATHTADGIDKLSELMRYTISGIHENFVPLESELKFIEQYLSIQLARLPEKDNIKIDIQISSSVKGHQIAPLILFPFIENAFKYGISMDEDCFVNTKIEVTVTSLLMEISNSIINLPITTEGNNTGIKNTVKRLELLYAGKYKLKQISDGREYKTSLTLTLTP